MKRRIYQLRKEFEGCITEISANKTRVAADDYNKGWNAASDHAIRFIRDYISGHGLFQDKQDLCSFCHKPERVTTHEVNGVVTREAGESPTREQKLLHHRFKITEAGIKAAGKERPDPKEHSNLPHRNRVYKTRTALPD